MERPSNAQAMLGNGDSDADWKGPCGEKPIGKDREDGIWKALF